MATSNDPDISIFEESLSRAVKYLCNTGKAREVLLVLAEALQRGLAANCGKEIPQSYSLEVVMRAVAAVIEGNPKMGSYIGEKLSVGIRSLVRTLKHDFPKFESTWDSEGL